jgi:hypothetical protein
MSLTLAFWLSFLNLLSVFNEIALVPLATSSAGSDLPI